MRSIPFRRVLLVAVVATVLRSAHADGPLTGRLVSTDPTEVYAAVEAAMASKDPQNAGSLLEAGWQTLHPFISVACGEALATLGPDAAGQSDLVKALAKAIKGKDPRGQQNLARVLGAWGDPSVDEPLSYLASGRRQPEVQAEGLYMCGRLKITSATPFSRCVQAVAAGLRSASPTVQMAACSAASRLKDPSFVDPLGEIVRQSQHEYAGLYAVWALGRMGRRGGQLGSFVHVIESGGKRETINGCLKGITDLSDAADVDALLALTRSTNVDVRDAACIALGTLAQRGEWAGPVVTPKEGEPPPPPPPGPDKVIARMIELVEGDVAWEVRDAASRTLLRIGESARPAVVAKMPSLVDAGERDVALTAMELCGEFRADAAVKELIKTATFDKDRVRRMFAARALSKAGPEQAATELLAGIDKDHKGRDTTLAMIRALGYVRHAAAYDGLVKLLTLGDASEEFLREVERALERLTGRRFGRKPARWATWYATVKDKEPFRPHLGHYDRSKNRREAVSKRLYGLTDTTERAVETGLRWLELQQHPEGAWDGNDKGFGGVVNCLPAYTGLSLLAFLGAGYSGVSGKYHETIRRASEFLAATQFYDGGFPVTGGGDKSWIFAYLIGMGVWGINEAYGLSDDDALRGPAQRGIDYLVRVQTPGAGWRYGPRYTETDSSCTSWVLMTMKTASMLGLTVADKAFDGIDSWLERCQYDITGQEELPEDMATDYDKEVGAKRLFKAFTGYFELKRKAESALQMTSMTAVGMICRSFMGWQRSHPFLIGSANYLMEYLPQWRKGLEKGQTLAWYFYFWYYGTLSMHQMGGRYWRAWNEKIKTMLPENQRSEPPALAGSWDPDTAVLNGGRLFSTAMAILTLETYYRFSPLMLPGEDEGKGKKKGAAGDPGPGMGEPGMGEPGMGG